MDKLYFNQKTKQTLTNLFEGGRLPHALLLEAPDGCGKTTLAKIIAAQLLCTAPNKPCGLCNACRKVWEGIHPDVQLVEHSTASRFIRVDDIRVLRETAFVLPNEGEKKIILLRNAQDMNLNAQNALLKLIEEPPNHCVFILTANNRRNLAPTLLSRVMILPLQSPTPTQCAFVLPELVQGKTAEEYTLAATLAEGNLKTAMELLQDEQRQIDFQSARAFCLATVRLDEYSLLRQLTAQEKDRAHFCAVLLLVKDIFFNTLLCLKGAPPAGETVQRLAETITPLQAASFIDIIEQALAFSQQNVALPVLSCNLCSQMKQALEQ